MTHTVSVAPSDRNTGVLAVREESASSLSTHATTGWKPVVHDRQDACPPTPAAPRLRVAVTTTVSHADMDRLCPNRQLRWGHCDIF